jgi:hypothetical protein
MKGSIRYIHQCVYANSEEFLILVFFVPYVYIVKRFYSYY